MGWPPQPLLTNALLRARQLCVAGEMGVRRLGRDSARQLAIHTVVYECWLDEHSTVELRLAARPYHWICTMDLRARWVRFLGPDPLVAEVELDSSSEIDGDA